VSEERKNWDVKNLGAGASIGGGVATIIISLVMNSMNMNNKAMQTEMNANNKTMQAEGKLAIEQIKNLTDMLIRSEKRREKEQSSAEKKFEAFQTKQDKIFELITKSTREIFTREDQNRHVDFVNERFKKIDLQIIDLKTDLIRIKKAQ